MQVMAYLIFSGECEAALEFYQEVLDARLEFMVRFQDSPDPNCFPAGAEKQIMHASLIVGDSRIMCSDDPDSPSQGFHGFALSLSVNNMQKARKIVDGLAQGGEIKIPLERSDWSQGFALVHDPFDIPWMINVAASQ